MLDSYYKEDYYDLNYINSNGRTKLSSIFLIRYTK